MGGIPAPSVAVVVRSGPSHHLRGGLPHIAPAPIGPAAQKELLVSPTRHLVVISLFPPSHSTTHASLTRSPLWHSSRSRTARAASTACASASLCSPPPGSWVGSSLWRLLLRIDKAVPGLFLARPPPARKECARVSHRVVLLPSRKLHPHKQRTSLTLLDPTPETRISRNRSRISPTDCSQDPQRPL